MKILTSIAAAIALAMPFGAKADNQQKKDAVLTVHFGTTHDGTRQKTIDAINRLVSDSLGNNFTTAEAYSSRIVRRRLAARGISKPTPREALLRLAADGYKNVFIQPTYLLDGVEYQALCNEAAQLKPFFDELQIGLPLLATTDDSQRVVDLLAQRYANLAEGKNHVVFVGHGSPSGANAIYSQLDYMFAAGGFPNIHVATVEGYPTFDTMLARLTDAHHVTLIPLLFVAGDHAANDIATDWRQALEDAGYEVDVVIEGLGENPDIQQIYLDHLGQAIAREVPDADQIKRQSIAEAE
ncbi:MAG: sirohydrochlorin cobaltochelatase [Roseburia sp.]|nr:sirohydrochlorin cobaltochelatase [Roseburia sp.]